MFTEEDLDLSKKGKKSSKSTKDSGQSRISVETYSEFISKISWIRSQIKLYKVIETLVSLTFKMWSGG